ncbi:MAG: gamma-glutamyltransferase family protein [Pseudomonadota bacterium]
MRDFHSPGRSTVIAANGMCATSHPLAAKVAVQMLEEGGNAVDAAIAAAVVLGICEPQMTGIGGDCFALVSRAGDDEIIALNGSGRAPMALAAEKIRKAGHSAIPPNGSEAVTIPGAIDAFCTLCKDHGSKGLDEILAPAIRYAEEGVPVAPRVAFDWAGAASILQDEAKRFFLFDGKAPKAGRLFRAPKQADVLRRIAAKGRAGFYEGEVAEDMVASLRALGGVHTLEDFARTCCAYTAPLSGVYKGMELIEHPPNGQGATALLVAGILSLFDLETMEPWGADRAHIETEAAKLAFDTRDRVLADADHTARLDHMLSPETAAALAALIDPKRAMPCPHALSEAVHKETVYLTVVDRDRMAVSLIYSIFHGFGSGLASSKYGILFQNRGAGFTLEPGHPNEAAGGKRPMHTIIPAMLRDGGGVMMPFGVMGGAYQPVGHARMLTNMIDFGLDAQSSIDAPRCFGDVGTLKMERGYPEKVRRELADRGHLVEIPAAPIGGAQAIWIDEASGTLHGASDARKDGCALGY